MLVGPVSNNIGLLKTIIHITIDKNSSQKGGHQMSEVTNQELLQAIKDLSGDVQEINRKLDSLETRVTNMETEMK